MPCTQFLTTYPDWLVFLDVSYPQQIVMPSKYQGPTNSFWGVGWLSFNYYIEFLLEGFSVLLFYCLCPVSASIVHEEIDGNKAIQVMIFGTDSAINFPNIFQHESRVTTTITFNYCSPWFLHYQSQVCDLNRPCTSIFVLYNTVCNQTVAWVTIQPNFCFNFFLLLVQSVREVKVCFYNLINQEMYTNKLHCLANGHDNCCW